jgi:16S rRNA (cytosine967-C5)-methyltransferase
VVAHDISPDRLRLIQENCQRLGVTCVTPVSGSDFAAQPPSSFDRIMVDAPCSNTGVMRRRVDLRWRITEEEIGRLRGNQSDLLRQSALLLKPGGVLVYSTCSLEPEENEQVVESFLKEQPAFTLASKRHLLPWTDGVDGAFVARLIRK